MKFFLHKKYPLYGSVWLSTQTVNYTTVYSDGQPACNTLYSNIKANFTDEITDVQ